jgi:hypothetical protein
MSHHGAWRAPAETFQRATLPLRRGAHLHGSMARRDVRIERDDALSSAEARSIRGMGQTEMSAAEDRALVGRLLAGEETAAEEFFALARDRIWKSCIVQTGGDSARAEAALPDVCTALGENNFERLGSFDGGARLLDFVALTVRDILRSRFVRQLSQDIASRWEFQQLFGEDIKRRIVRDRRMQHDEERAETAFDYIVERLTRNDCRRLRTYNGGHFPSFLKTAVKNLLSDFFDQPAEGGALREPVAIARLSLLDRFVYREIYVNGNPADPDVLLRKAPRQAGAVVTREDILESIERVERVWKALPPESRLRSKLVPVPLPDAAEDGWELADSTPGPDDPQRDEEIAALEDAAFKVMIPEICRFSNQDLVLLIREITRDEKDPVRERENRERLIRRLPEDVQILLEQVDWKSRGRPPTTQLGRIFAVLRKLAAHPAVERWLRAIRGDD